MSTETFDEFRNPTFLETEVVAIGGITYTPDAPGSRWFAGEVLGSVSPPNGLYVENSTGPRTLTLEGRGFVATIETANLSGSTRTLSAALWI